jgi:excisionase family DNA binding protein
MSDPTPAPEKWLTLVEAAGRLHVHPTTLRRWANNGDIPVMVTPGGHRRFAESDVNRFADARHSIYKPGRLEQMWVNQALAQTRKEMSARPTDQPWLDKFDEDARKNHRLLGQRLMGLLLRFLTTDSEDESLIEKARQIGDDYARSAQRVGLPLIDALRASMFFRDTLIATTHQMPDNMRIRPESKMRLLRRITTLLNTVQLAVAEAYDANQADRLPGS